MLKTIGFLIIAVIALANAYVFDCLDQCECDTEDEVVHCHDGQRTRLALPSAGKRLRGFPIIGLTYNDIRVLPDEDVLLNRFPDLKAIDVERNPNFDCETVNNYNEIKIISDCDKNVSSISRVPHMYRPTKNCDVSCQAERHYKKLHEYVLQLWEVIKEKYQNFDLDATLKQIREFFSTVVIKVKKLHNEVQAKMDERDKFTPLETRMHPKDIAVPTAEDIVIPPAANDEE